MPLVPFLYVVGILIGTVVAAIPLSFLVPFPVATAISCFTIGVVLTEWGHARTEDDRYEIRRFSLGMGYLFLALIGPILLATWLREEMSWQANRWLLLLAAAAAVMLPVGIAARIALRAARWAAIRGWYRWRRRRLAAARGWQFRRSSPATVAQLREAQQHISAGPLASSQDQASGVITGEANGRQLTAFDYFRPGGWRPPVGVATAVLVELPAALPPFHPRFPNARPPTGQRWNLVEGSRHDPDPARFSQLFDTFFGVGEPTPASFPGLFDAAFGEARRLDDPPRDDLGRAVLTTSVAAMTRRYLPWWWISGRWLAVAVPGRHGMPAGRLAGTVDTATRLASMLDWTALARHVVPSDQVNDPDATEHPSRKEDLMDRSWRRRWWPFGSGQQPPGRVPRTIAAQQVELTVDHTGLLVRQRRASGGWRVHRRLTWDEVTQLVFQSESRDPVVALYAVTATGRRYLLDSSHLSRPQWADLAEAVDASTGGRLRIDLAARENPRFVPDS